MTLAIVILGLLNFAQFGIIYGLLNRVLTQAKVQPLKPVAEPEPESRRERARRVAFKIPVTD